MSGPVRVLELRSVFGTGGGPEKTILEGARLTPPDRIAITICYIKDARDRQFTIGDRARAMGLDYVELVERHSFDWRVLPALKTLVRDRDIDIVHAHEHKTDLFALLLGRRGGPVPLSTAHGWSGTSRKERLYYAVDRRLLARYPMVVAVSEPIRQAIIRAGARPERVRTILNGIDHRRFMRTHGVRERVRQTLGIPQSAFVIGTIGRLEQIKRYDVFLEAVARLAINPPPVVVMVGAGPSRDAIEACARRLGLAGRVSLLGQRDDVLELYQAFDVFVQSSDSEGVSNAVLEAMALEVPIVATDVGGTSQILRHGVDGLLTPRRSPEQLARAIESVLENAEAAAARVRSARQRVESELSFDRRVERLNLLYEELAAGRRAAAQVESGLSWR